MNPWILTGLTLEAVMDVIEDGQTVEEVLQSDKWWGSVNGKRDALLGDVFQSDYIEKTNDDVDKVTPNLLPKLKGWGTWEALSDIMIARNSVCWDTAWDCCGFEENYRREVAALIMIANFGKKVENEDDAIEHIFGNKDMAEASPHAYKILKALRTNDIQSMIDYARTICMEKNDIFLLGCMSYNDGWKTLLSNAQLPSTLEKYKGDCVRTSNLHEVHLSRERRFQEFNEYDPEHKIVNMVPEEKKFHPLLCADKLSIVHPSLGSLTGILSVDEAVVAWLCDVKLKGDAYEIRLLGNRRGPFEDAILDLEWLKENYNKELMLGQARPGLKMFNPDIKDIDKRELDLVYNMEYDRFDIVDKHDHQTLFGAIAIRNRGFWFIYGEEKEKLYLKQK